MEINREFILLLKPCQDRLDNFTKEYPEFNGSFIDLLKLDKITYSDKVWMIKKTQPREILIKWSTKCAESVLHIFEKKYPNDKRPRECVEYLLKGDFSDREQLSKYKNTAADAAYAVYAVTYADAADAAYAVYAVTYAAYAVYVAADAADAVYAVYVVADAAAGRKTQEEKNINLMVEILEQA